MTLFVCADYARRAANVRMPARGEDQYTSNEVHTADCLFSGWAVLND
jgi:hypothetical protein